MSEPEEKPIPPTHVRQDLETQVQLLPPGTTAQRVASRLTDELLATRNLRRLDPDRMRESTVRGPYAFMSLTATDVNTSLNAGWRGSAELAVEYNDDQGAPLVRIRVGGYSGFRGEEEAAADARVMFRIGELVEHAFRLDARSHR
ncbi:MAG: hypothetical protein AB1941_00805 [Gemmatimonadota bacterium]